MSHRPPTSASQATEGFAASGTSRRAASTARQIGTIDLPLVRHSLQGQGLSSESATVVLSAWRRTTQAQYKPYFQRWQVYCSQRETDPLRPPLSTVINFLTELYSTGIGYSAINTAKSAVSSLFELPGGGSIGRHPLVVRYMKGIFESRPSLPRYCCTWDVGQVLTYLQRQNLQHLSLKDLTLKTTMLLCLLTGQRIQTLAAIDCANLVLGPGKHIQPLELSHYGVENLCVVRYLYHYVTVT